MTGKVRIELLLVALVTFGPVLGAYWLYHSGHGVGLPRLENPERRIVEPPVPLPPLRVLAGGRDAGNAWSGGRTWSLLYARTAPCDDGCFGSLVRLYQVELSLGVDQERIQRVYLGPVADSRVMRDATILTAALDGAGAELLARLRAAGEAPGAEGRLYVVDPRGLLVLGYPPNADRGGLRKDLKRLLDGSGTG